MGPWGGIDPNSALHEDIVEEHCEQSDENQIHHSGTVDTSTVHGESTALHNSPGRVGGKSEWSFAPAAAPKFMASAAWAGSRAAGAADISGGPGYDGPGRGLDGRSGGAAEWGGAEGAGQGEVRGGWLLKKAESSWGWRRRWFILHPGRLTYQARSPRIPCGACAFRVWMTLGRARAGDRPRDR